MSRFNLYARLIGVVNIIKDSNNEIKTIRQAEATQVEETIVLKNEVLALRNELKILREETQLLRNDVARIITAEGIDSSLYCSTDSLSFKNACFALELHETHKQSFAEFKGIHSGKSVVVVGTGPTMKYYKNIQNTPHIGVNKSFLNPNIKLDYYFTTDNESKYDYYRELRNYDFIKFFGQYPPGIFRDTFQFSEDIIQENKGRRFYQSEPNEDINLSPEFHPLMGFYSIIFQAIHFALYTGANTIYLVGCDCSSDGYYDNTTQTGNVSSAMECWKRGYESLDKYVKQFYPNVKIVSINPVGLRGLFHDVYTLDYLNDMNMDLNKYDLITLDPNATENECK